MDDTDYPEYNPEPYRGGYDPEAVYGKPRSPSEKSCYPPFSQSNAAADTDLADDDDGRGSVISAYGVELPDFGDEVQPAKAVEPEMKPSNAKEKDKEQRQEKEKEKEKEQEQAKELERDKRQNYSYDWEWPEYDYASYYNSGYADFVFTFDDPSQRDLQDSAAYCPSDDISEKVASWLFSTPCI